eukprot:525556_1
MINGTTNNILNLNTVFLPIQHNKKITQKLTNTLNVKEGQWNQNHKLLYQRYGRFSVNRPLNTTLNQKKAFISLLNFSPNTNKQNKINTTFNHSHTTSFIKCYEINITPTNKQYKIYMNNEYDTIISFIINKNIPTPLYIRNAFNTKLNPQNINVSSGAIQIMTEENAGGCSELSEGFSFEILKQCFNAILLKTEMSIKYWWTHWKKTDYSVCINNIKIGVSVTRAMKYNGIFDKKDALKLLIKKLNGVNESTEGVLECDQWQ